jgi:hypothetical protein
MVGGVTLIWRDRSFPARVVAQVDRRILEADRVHDVIDSLQTASRHLERMGARGLNPGQPQARPSSPPLGMLLGLMRSSTKDQVSSVVRVVSETSKVGGGVHIWVGERRVRVPICNLARDIIEE